MAVVKKDTLQPNVFEGISAVYAVASGLTFVASGGKNNLVLTNTDLLEFPVSEDSGFSFDTGAPSIEHFKVHGLNADWVSTFTPGDTELSLEIPCHDTQIMELCFGNSGTDINITMPTAAVSNGTDIYAAGKAFGPSQKSVNLGLLILNDTEDKLFFIKQAKLTAQVTFDGSNKPLCVVLSGSLGASGEDSFGVLDLSSNAPA